MTILRSRWTRTRSPASSAPSVSATGAAVLRARVGPARSRGPRRRRHLLDPVAITTAPAPVLADGHIDVCAGGPPVPPAHAPELDPPVVDLTRQIGPTSPGYEPGRCFHRQHVVFDGLRYGVTPLTADAVLNAARLTLCHHRRSQDGE